MPNDQYTDAGLPILNNQAAQTTDSGLPIFKKKESTTSNTSSPASENQLPTSKNNGAIDNGQGNAPLTQPSELSAALSTTSPKVEAQNNFTPTDIINHLQNYTQGLDHIKSNLPVYSATIPKKDGYSWERKADVIGHVGDENVNGSVTNPVADWAQNAISKIDNLPDVGNLHPEIGLGKELVKSTLGSIAGLAQGSEQISKGSGELEKGTVGSVASGLTQIAAGMVKSGFSGLSLINPELATFNAGTQIASDALPSDVIPALMSPLSTLLQKTHGVVVYDNNYYDIGNSDGVKAAAELGDLAYQILAFHGAKELGAKVLSNKPLTPEEQIRVNDITRKGIDEIGDATKVTKEQLLQQPAGLPDKTKIQLAAIPPKISQQIPEHLTPETKVEVADKLQQKETEEVLKEKYPLSAPIHEHNIEALNLQARKLAGITEDETPPKPKKEGAEPEPKIPEGWHEVKKDEYVPPTAQFKENFKGTGKTITDAPAEIQVKQFAKGDGGTKGIFVGDDGQLYKSLHNTEVIQDENGNFKRIGSEHKTNEYDILNELQDNPNVVKIGDKATTSEGEAFKIEKLTDAGEISYDEYRQIENAVEDINKKGIEIGDKISVMRNGDGKLVLNDFSTASKRKNANDDGLLFDVKDKLSKQDQERVSIENTAQLDRQKANDFLKPRETHDYLLTQRPPSIGTHPSGAKITETKIGDRKVWKLSYDKPLTQKEIKSFELTPILDPKENIGTLLKSGNKYYSISDINQESGEVTIKTRKDGERVEKKLSGRDFNNKINEGDYEIIKPQEVKPQEPIVHGNEVPQTTQENSNVVEGDTPEIIQGRKIDELEQRRRTELYHAEQNHTPQQIKRFGEISNRMMELEDEAQKKSDEIGGEKDISFQLLKENPEYNTLDKELQGMDKQVSRADEIAKLSPKEQDEIKEYEDLSYKMVAAQGREAGYKPYKLTQKQKARYFELRDKYKDIFFRSKESLRKENEINAKYDSELAKLKSETANAVEGDKGVSKDLPQNGILSENNPSDIAGMKKFKYKVLQETDKAIRAKVPYWENASSDLTKRHTQKFIEVWIPKSVIEKGDAATKQFVIGAKEKIRQSNPYQKRMNTPTYYDKLGEYAPTREKKTRTIIDRDKVQELINGLENKYNASLRNINIDGLAEDKGILADQKLAEALEFPTVSKADRGVPTKQENYYEDINPETKQQITPTNESPIRQQPTEPNIESNPSDKNITGGGEKTGGDTGVATEEEKAILEESQGGGNKVGVSHGSLGRLADKLGLPQPLRGQRLSPKEFADRGRRLLDAGADPKQVESDFKKGIQPSADDISVARAHLEDLYREQNRAGDAFEAKRTPKNKKAFDDATNAVQQWTKEVVKPMGTKASEPFTALQGERDIDTGSFTAIKNARSEVTGKAQTDLPEPIKQLSEKVKHLEEKTNELQKQLTDALNKKTTEKKPIVNKERLKKIDDYFDGLKSDLDKNVYSTIVPIPVIKGAIEAMRAAAKAGSIAADVIQAGINYVSKNHKGEFDEQAFRDKYEEPINKFIEERGDKIKELQEANVTRLQDELQRLKDENKLKSTAEKRDYSEGEKELQNQIEIEKDRVKYNNMVEQFADKKDNDLKFTPEQSANIWEYAKKNYIDNNPSFKVVDMVNKVAMDLGLTPEQVRHALGTTAETRKLSDQLYRNQYEKNKAHRTIQRWVNKTDDTPVTKLLDALASPFRSLATLGHGHALLFTHAGSNLFDPQVSRKFLTAVVRQFKLVYGDKANYEKAQTDLQNHPLYNKALQAGTAVDPTTVYDDWQLASSFLQKLHVQGNKGFLVLKMMRMELFANEYNHLSDIEKADPNVMKVLAENVNHWTGTAGLKVLPIANAFVFAPNLIASKFSRLTIDPARALYSVGREIAGKEVSAADRAASKIILKKTGRVLATYAAALAANQAMLYLSGSNQNVNFTHPTRSDWLRFKTGDAFGGRNVDVTGGMTSTMQFMTQLGLLPFESQKDTKEDYHGARSAKDATQQEIMGYLHNTLSPFGGTVYDFLSHTDYAGNVLPMYNDKPQGSREKLSYLQYVGEKLPIPVADALKTIHDQMVEEGVSKVRADQIVGGFLAGGIASMGIKVGSKSKAPQNPFTDQDLKDPIFKYFIDKGFTLPNVSLQSVQVTDTKNGTQLHVSDYPKEKQQEYKTEHNSQLKTALSEIEDKGNVYVSYYKDAKGNKVSDVSLNYNPKATVVPLDKLTKEETAQVLSMAQKIATTKAKNKVFFNKTADSETDQSQSEPTDPIPSK